MPNPENVARSVANLAASRPRATVAIGFVQGMLAGLPRSGHAAAPLLVRAGIAPQVLDDPAARVPVERYAALYNLINHELDDEGFGLFSAPMRVGSFEFLCRSVITAPTLTDALERAARFLHVVLPDFVVTLKRDGGEARLSIAEAQPLHTGRVFAFEWLLRLLHGLSSWLVGRAIVLDAVSFPYPRPGHADDYALIYTARSSFDAETSGGTNAEALVTPLVATLAANLLDLPVRRDEAALQTFLIGAPGRLTMLYRRDREMVLRVRDCLRDALPEAKPLAAVASALHLSPRTLHRRLEEEGSSFQAIKDALRRDLAINRLAKTQQPLAQIAVDLGFADASAFYRAFVSWTGMAPAHYRRRLQRPA
jgi:AraC-like DNA-binding protein